MRAYAGNKYLPVLAHNPDGNYRARMTDYILGPGTRIVPCLAHDLEGETACIYEVILEWVHIADAASLEAALAILSNKYTSKPDLEGIYA